MKTDITTLRDSLNDSYDQFFESRMEAEGIWNLYHNRQYTEEQLHVLENRGQPKETFNVIKLYSRMLLGYWSTSVNEIVAKPKHPDDTTSAVVLSETINHILKQNNFDTESDSIKLSGLISGLMVSSVQVKETNRTDQFNRTINEIFCGYVPDYEVLLDPMSRRDDYEDARFLHRFKWITREDLIKLFGKKAYEKVEENYNFTQAHEAEPGYRDVYDGESYGAKRYGGLTDTKVDDNYLVVHTVIIDDAGKRWSIFWHDETVLLKEEITYSEVKWPYRVQKLYMSDRIEYYGLFREVAESQKAINQAVIKVQQLINTEKYLVESNAVEDVSEFERTVHRVSGVIPVLNAAGVVNLKSGADVEKQYIIIDKALERIQRVLGVNDSFLGMAYASDSGRKVKLQQGATIMSLQYATKRVKSFYKHLAQDISKLAKQYYTSNQFLNITDKINGDKWLELNKPITRFNGQFDANGEPIREPILLEQYDEHGKLKLDADGNIILTPVPEALTNFNFSEYDIEIEILEYNDEDEKSQLLVESLMQGTIGQMLAQTDPAAFFELSALVTKTTGTRYSNKLAEILQGVANSIAKGEPTAVKAIQAAMNQNLTSGGNTKTTKIPMEN